MLKAFCAASNIKAFVHQPGCPSVLKECGKLLEEYFGGDTRGTLLHDIHTLKALGSLDENPAMGKTRTSTLDNELYCVLSVASEGFSDELPGWKLSRQVQLRPRLSIRGVQFADSSTTARNSVVFFQPALDGASIPGVIRQIFIVEGEGGSQHYLLAIHRYAPATIPDPFVRYQDFGAGLWSQALQEQVEIVPASRKLSHAIQREWDDWNFVMKSLDRVRNHTEYLHFDRRLMMYTGLLIYRYMISVAVSSSSAASSASYCAATGVGMAKDRVEAGAVTVLVGIVITVVISGFVGVGFKVSGFATNCIR